MTLGVVHSQIELCHIHNSWLGNLQIHIDFRRPNSNVRYVVFEAHNQTDARPK